MPIPEGYLPRKGDVVVLHGTVVYDVRDSSAHDEQDENGPLVWVRLLKYHSDARIPVSTVVGVHSYNLDVGATVKIDGDVDEGGEIIAIHDGFAWCKFTRPGRQDSYATYAVAALIPYDRVDVAKLGPNPDTLI